MRCNRMVMKNVEIRTLDEEPFFIYQVETQFTRVENAPATFFPVREIELMRNGWVRTSSHDDMPDEFFPPWRIVALEGYLDG